MKIPMLAALAAVAVVAPLATAPARSAAAAPHVQVGPRVVNTLAEKPIGKLEWGTCPDDVTAAPGLECSTLKVPLDYGKPHGKTIEIAISRLRSTDPAHRRGVLFTNSGGPGGTGLAFPTTLVTGGQKSQPLPQSVRDRYDIIGIDPRGVGHSTPVTCNLPTSWSSNIPPYARTQANVTRQAERSKQIASACGSSSTSTVLPYITTANTARDLDRVRAALGEKKVSYLGISYGTYLGAVYTTMFPGRSDRIVLDSALSPGGWNLAFQRRIAQGFQDRFPDFARYVSAHPDLGLGTTAREVSNKYNELADQLDTQPGTGGFNGADFRQATFALLYYDEDFPSLAAAWRTLDRGEPLPERTLPTADNFLSSQLHVICNDSVWPSEVSTYRHNVITDKRRYPMFGGATANISPCAFWPTRPQEAKIRITDHGPSNVLISQNLRDPVTPVAGALALRRAFGDRARIVTADQGGHLAYLWQTNNCLNDTVTHFLTTGKSPERDLACRAQPATTPATAKS